MCDTFLQTISRKNVPKMIKKETILFFYNRNQCGRAERKILWDWAKKLDDGFLEASFAIRADNKKAFTVFIQQKLRK